MKTSSTLKSILSFLVMITSLCSAAWSTTYYVSSGGNDNNSGAVNQPWRTVSKVNGSTFSAGDSILFRSGENWSETLRPSSGTGGSEVVYASYGSGDKPHIRNFSAVGKSNVIVDGLELETTSSTFTVIIENSDYITFRNCEIYASSSADAYCVVRIEKGSDHNSILNCHIEHKNMNDQNDVINIHYNSNYNLIEGNMITGSTHTVLGMTAASNDYPNYESRYNIIRMNTIENYEARPLSINTNSNFNLIEHNKILGGKETQYCSGGQTFKMVTSNNIIRKNIITGNSSNSGGGLAAYVYRYSNYPPNIAEKNYIYHNVITGLYGRPVVYGNSGYGDGCYVENNAMSNNAIYANDHDNQINIRNHSGISDNYFDHNLIWKAGESNVIYFMGSNTDVSGIESSDPAYFSGNVQQDPNYDSEYRPLTGSPCIDKGKFLTTITTNSGSGTTFIVVDAHHFMDGWGIIEGDLIQLEGQTQRIRITDVDYSTNTITVDQSISWNMDQGVALAYEGAAPDIGAYEYVDSITTGRDSYDQRNTNLLVYPNPAGNELTVILPDNDGKQAIVTLMNSLGQVVIHKSFINEPSYRLFTGHLPKGIYILEVHIGNERLIRKIVKQ